MYLLNIYYEKSKKRLKNNIKSKNKYKFVKFTKIWYNRRVGEKEGRAMEQYRGKRIKENNNKNNRKRMKKRNPIKIIGVVGSLALLALVGNEVKEHLELRSINESAELTNVPRSFKNIDKENMGKYLENQIKVLYNKYPSLDEWIYRNSDELNDKEVLKDIISLYKAIMIDEAYDSIITDKETKESIEAIDEGNISNEVKIVMAEGLGVSSDQIQVEGEDGTQKTIEETYKQSYKAMTEAYLEAMDGKISGADLARKIYELCADEIGLVENVPTTKEIAKQIEENGFFCDPTTDTFYRTDGEYKLVPVDENTQNIESKKTEEETNDMQQETEGYEIGD